MCVSVCERARDKYVRKRQRGNLTIKFHQRNVRTHTDTQPHIRACTHKYTDARAHTQHTLTHTTCATDSHVLSYVSMVLMCFRYTFMHLMQLGLLGDQPEMDSFGGKLALIVQKYLLN